MMTGPAGGWAAAVPSRCAVCGRWPARPVCAACLRRFAPRGCRCDRCALPVPDGVATCGACLRQPPPLDLCLAAVPYAYPWSGLIARFKFRGEPAWASELAALLAGVAALPQALAAVDVVVPLPLSPQRLSQRGFNQAWELARRLAPGRADAALLLRVRDTPSQAALGREDRRSNVDGAFAMEPLRAARAQGARVLLVDDVMTSGASLHAAARALRAAGAAWVGAAVVARTADVPE